VIQGRTGASRGNCTSHIFIYSRRIWENGRTAELNFRHFGRYWLPIEIERTSWNSIRESRITELKPLIFKLTIAIAYSSESIRNKWSVLSRTSTALSRKHKVQLSCQGKECTGKTLTKCSLRTFSAVAKRGKDRK